MTNIRRLVLLVLITVVMSSNSVIAEQLTVEVTENCSPSSKEAKWTVYNGIPGIQFSLTSLGIEASGNKELIDTWGDFMTITETKIPVFVQAKCVTKSEIGMLMHKKGDMLICSKGDGIKLLFMQPNNSDPKKYIYHALLTINSYDKDNANTV